MLLCLLLAGLPRPSSAGISTLAPAVVQQAKTVQGSVVDEQGQPIIGANVKVMTRQGFIGTVTDVNGGFSLPVPVGGKLSVSYIGYVTQTLSVPSGGMLKVTLVEDAQSIEEVVIVGYGTQKMKNVTGAISTIDPNEISNLPVASLGVALQGMVSGLSVSGGQSRPGSQPSLVVRTPFNLSKDGGDSSPLYIIDDFVSDAATFNNLNPNDVENISILKDAAAAVYGARSAQGVVLVKTKLGKMGKPKISYSGQVGYNNEITRPKLMDSYQYGSFWNAFQGSQGNAQISNHKTSLFQADELEAMKEINYNWLDEVWEPAVSMKHNLNLTGGMANATYFASVSYFTQDGNLNTLKYERWNWRAGINVNVAKHLKTTLQISGDYSESTKTFNKVGGENDENDYTTLFYTPPYIPYEVAGMPIFRYGVSNSQQNQIQQYNFFAVRNLGDKTVNQPQNNTIAGTFQYDFDWIKPLKGLQLRFAYSRSFGNTKANNHGSKYTQYYFNQRGGSGNHLYIGEDLTAPTNIKSTVLKNGNRLMRDMGRSDRYQMNFNVSYGRTFGKHTVSGLFSIEKTSGFTETSRVLKEDPLSFDNGQSNTATGSLDLSQFSRSESGMLSYVGRFNYSYHDRYLFEFLFRSDASTKFAPENYWAVFPGVSAGWVISEERWFREHVSWIDFLKLRGSFGLLGKDDTKPWQWQQRYTYQNNKGAVFGTTDSQLIGWGLKMEAAPNRDAHWSNSYKWNLGIDAKFLSNRLSVGYNMYLNRNTELLVQRDASVPPTVGGVLAAENYDAIDDYGFELSLGWRSNIGRFNYRVGLNTSLTGATYRRKDWPDLISFNGVYPGGPTDMGHWGYDYIGMFRSRQDIDDYVAKYNITKYMGMAPEDIKPGMLIYRDIRGDQNPDGSYQGPDGIIDGKDQIRLTRKSGNPYGFSLNLGGDFKNFSFSAQIASSWGGWSELPVISMDSKKIQYMNLPPYWSDMFVPEDIVDEQGRVVAPQNLTARYPNMAFSSVNNVSSRFWQISSFRMTLRLLSLGYTLPKTWMKKVNVESCKLSFTGSNLLSFYNPYPDHFMDPMGSYATYPSLRNLSLALNITF
jgi:TonB-linked SusC/RagA family outer membrane protein